MMVEVLDKGKEINNVTIALKVSVLIATSPSVSDELQGSTHCRQASVQHCLEYETVKSGRCLANRLERGSILGLDC